MKQPHLARLQIGTFEVDWRSGDLHDGGHKTVLQEQPLQVLRLLAEAGGELVTREEIRRKLWPDDTVVEFDHSINAAIMSLRRALGDSAGEPKYIQTVVRRGYRLLVPVKWISADDPVGGVSAVVDGAAVRPQPDAVLLGKKVSHYRVLEIIGGGGMGLVYKAEDLKLGRQVALKFLPEELASDPVALQRFEREARTASSLDHPNVCTIYEVEEHAGEPFIVMQLLRGETLRDCLAALGSANQKLPLEKLLDVAVQVCSGLEAAHAKGIIHRDIKPANIFLTGSGQVKILDFGLAKEVVGAQQRTNNDLAIAAGAAVTEQSRAPDNGVRAPDRGQSQPLRKTSGNADATLTGFGVALGTAGYMSPEQIRGEPLDARTDIFSFGLVLYEMATGERAFTGETEAILHDAIQHRDAKPVRELAPGVSPVLAAVIDKCLEKERDQRFSDVTEIRTTLAGVQHELSTTLSSSFESHDTNRSRRTRWLVVFCATVLCAVAAGVLYRVERPAPKLASNRTIVLADFENKTGDPMFDSSLNNALRIGLEQTPFLNLLTTEKVNRVLKELGHQDALTFDRAREICSKTNSAAVVIGSISDAGNQYRIEIKASRCDTGTLIANAESVADQLNAVVKQLGVAALVLRKQLGESSKTLQDFNKALETATTSSVPALRAVTLGQQYMAAGNPRLAVDYFRHAIESDSNFALAYWALGSSLWTSFNREEGRENIKRAYDLRDRVTPLQRILFETQYFSLVTSDLESGQAVLREAIKIYPNIASLHHFLSWTLQMLGRYEESTAESREAIRLDPDNMASYYDLVRDETAMERYDDAKAAFEATRAHGLDGELLRIYTSELAFVKGDGALLRDQLSWLLEHARSSGDAWEVKGEIAAHHGQMRDARRFLREAQSIATRSGSSDAAAESLWEEALREAWIGNSDLAKNAASQAVTLDASTEVTPEAAFTFALLAELNKAEEIADKLSQRDLQNTLLQKFDLPCIRALIAIRRGNSAEAIRLLQSSQYDLAEGNLLLLTPIYVRGLAYLESGRPQEAANEFRQILNHPGTGAMNLDPWGPAAHIQLARAYAMMGDAESAGKSYEDFLTLWKDADPDIPIYRQAKAEYAKLR